MPNLRCLDPTSTMEYVGNCPDSKYTWDQAAARKGCHRIFDNCLGLPKQGLEYHCVINPYMNETVEVCAPSRRMFGGFCPEYSFLAEGVQENFDVDCKNFKNPCPTFFMSTDAYKYQECYTMINRGTTPSAKETSPNQDSWTIESSHSTQSTESTPNAEFSIHNMFIVLGAIVLVAGIILFIGTLRYCLKRRKQHNNWGNEHVKSEKEKICPDIKDYETGNLELDSISHLISDSNKHDCNNGYCKTGIPCNVQTKQASTSIVSNSDVLNNYTTFALNKSIANNPGTKRRTSNRFFNKSITSNPGIKGSTSNGFINNSITSKPGRKGSTSDG